MHELIGQIITYLLCGIAAIFGLAACAVSLWKYVDEFSNADLDLIGSHLVGEDGKWDFSKDEKTPSGSPRYRIHKPAYQVYNPDFEGWEVVNVFKDEETGQINGHTRTAEVEWDLGESIKFPEIEMEIDVD